jgi:hypothetical protein
VWSKVKETIKRSASRNIRFIQAAMSVVKSTHLKLYSCKYAKKTYTPHQLLVLILFKDYRNQHYREFIEDIGDMENVQEILDLSALPHFTTLQKILCRIKSLYLRITFKNTLNLFYSNDDTIPITVIDASGFTNGYYSHYFSERTGKIRKHFLKTSISVDTEQQVITGFVASKSRSTTPGMPRNYSDNVTKRASPIVMSWTKDTILKRFIASSAPGTTRPSAVLIVRRWLVSSMTWFIPGDNSLKTNSLS